MRNAFIDELTALAAVHDHIALVVGDLGYSVVGSFAERFTNAGVAEQNMMGLAAGMASAVVLTGEATAEDVAARPEQLKPTLVLDRIDRLIPMYAWIELGWAEA